MPGRRSRTSHGFTDGAHASQGATQTIPGGPFASQEAIKELGTNGGGPFNANSAHPFENPTPFTNMLEIFALLLIPFALAYAFGRLVEGHASRAGRCSRRWRSCGAGRVAPSATATRARDAARPSGSTALRRGGNMEGKEVRFGAPVSGIFAASTTGTSTGAVNSSHDSFTPLGGPCRSST